MLGGSNFDAVESKTPNAGVVKAEENAPKNPAKLTQFRKQEIGDLKFLKDNYDWAAVLKFNNFLEKRRGL